MSHDSIRQFKGLNTVGDPLRLGLGWLARADNVDITATGALRQRAGYTRASTQALAALYATQDTTRMYAVAGGELVRVHPDMSTVALAPVSSRGYMHWAEQDERVYFNNGREAGIITEDDTVLPWRWEPPGAPALSTEPGALDPGAYQVCFTFILADGRETGAGESATITLVEGEALRIDDVPQAPGCATALYIAPANSTEFQFAGSPSGTFLWDGSPDMLGANLTTALLNPLPQGCDVVQLWKGRAYAAQYLPAANQTAVWVSRPLLPHLFGMNDGFFMVAGRVLALAPGDEALIVGTDAALYAYTGEGIKVLAPYGVPPGVPWAKDPDTGELAVWTLRGVCSVEPFANLTTEYLSVPPGLQAAACFMQRGGDKKFVTSLVQGGAAFNPKL